MKTGIIIDVHGHFENLQWILTQLDALNCDRVICLGDLVGGDDDENDRCIALLKELVIPTVIGGHDEACLKSNCPAIEGESKSFLEGVPLFIEEGPLYFIHDNPLENAKDEKGMWYKGGYIRTSDEADVVFDDCDLFANGTDIVFVGHTHLPKVFVKGAELEIEFNQPISLDDGGQYIINPGAVGGAFRGSDYSFALHDGDEKWITFFGLG